MAKTQILARGGLGGSRPHKTLEQMREDDARISTIHGLTQKLAELGAQFIKGEITRDEARLVLSAEINLWRGVHGRVAVSGALRLFQLSGFDT
jgi:hypothetical protein